MRAMLGELARRARRTLDDETPNLAAACRVRTGRERTGALIEVLARWAEANRPPLVLVIDEIDALIGDTLLSVLLCYDSCFRHKLGRDRAGARSPRPLSWRRRSG